MTSPQPLPISAHLCRRSGFRAFCQRKQLDYIAAERWRYGQAVNRLPAWSRGAPMPDVLRAAWAVLDLHHHTRAELQARLDQLDQMEQEALHNSEWLDFTAFFAAGLHNQVSA